MVLSAHGGPRYRQELLDVRQLLLEMGGLAEECLATSIDGLIGGSDEEVARARALEREINALEKDIDERCIKILALHQPAASELRFVAMAMKISTDLERIGDLAENVARRAEQMREDDGFKIPGELPRMSRAVREMIAEALDAFVERSAERAHEVLERDDEVDDLHWTLYRRFEALMGKRPEFVPRGLRLIHVIKDLERAADHATNIAEGVIYMVRGHDVRHEPGT